jgi:sec-independent protein translocase protein TatA
MWQIVVIVLLIVLLVGYKRLPDMARSVGRSLRIFKSEVEQLTDKDDEPDDDYTTDRDRSRRSDAPPSRLESGPERRDDDNEPRRG